MQSNKALLDERNIVLFEKSNILQDNENQIMVQRNYAVKRMDKNLA